MTGKLKILRAGPLATLQDAGRQGMLRYGIGASGPMVTGAYEAAGSLLDAAGETAIEFTRTGMDFTVDIDVRAAFCGGDFTLSVNSEGQAWNASHSLAAGDVVRIAPGAWGNYGYVRLDSELDVPLVLGSRATNSTVGLGGFGGRALVAGDIVPLGDAPVGRRLTRRPPQRRETSEVRVLWGLHADLFPSGMRQRFIDTDFRISKQLDRMGVRLERQDVFADSRILSLVSDAVVAGDIQILGDGTPIVLMRDHQPTGGYPRIATVISADLDHFAQMRPGSVVRFRPVTLDAALAAKASSA